MPVRLARAPYALPVVLSCLSWYADQVEIPEPLLWKTSCPLLSCLSSCSRANSVAACGKYPCADWAAGSTLTTTHNRTAAGGILAWGAGVVMTPPVGADPQATVEQALSHCFVSHELRAIHRIAARSLSDWCNDRRQPS